MAEENAVTVITYEDVKQAVGEADALETYRQIARIAGGDENPNHDGGLSIDEKAAEKTKTILEEKTAEAKAAIEKAKAEAAKNKGNK